MFVGGGVNLRTLNRNRNPNRIETPRSHNCEQKTEVAAAHLATSPAGAGIRGKGEDGGYAVAMRRPKDRERSPRAVQSLLGFEVGHPGDRGRSFAGVQ